MKSKQYLYNIFHIHSSQFLIRMAQKSEEIMPDPDAIIRLRRDRLLGANLTGCDVNFCWMILIQKKCQALSSVLPRPCLLTKYACFAMFCSHLKLYSNLPVSPACRGTVVPELYTTRIYYVRDLGRKRRQTWNWDRIQRRDGGRQGLPSLRSWRFL